MSKLRVAICGYGGLGRVHTGSIVGMDDVEIVAVCDIDPAKLKPVEIKTNLANSGPVFDISQCHGYTQFRTMLRRETLDAVVMALPTDLHAHYAILAMKAGLHVFGEKPMALTPKQCDRMIAARDASKVQLQIGQCLRFWPEYEALRLAIQNQTYGRLESLVMSRISGYCTWSDWFNDGKRSGGAILDLHLHDVDWAQYALGQPKAILAAGTTGRSGAIDDVTALWRYEDSVVTLRGSWKYQAFAMSFQAYFENGAMEFGMHPDPALRVKVAGRADFEKAALPLQGNGYVNELRYFFDSIQGKVTNTTCTAESTRRSVELVMLENKSIARKKWITIAG